MSRGQRSVHPLASTLGAWGAALTAAAHAAMRPVVHAVPAQRRAPLAAALAVVALALLGRLAVWPAWQTLAMAEPRLVQLDAQLVRMRQMAAQAAQWRAEAGGSAAGALRPLEQVLAEQAPSARLSWRGPVAVVSVGPLSGPALVDLLDELGRQAGARVLEAQMQQVAPGQWQGGLGLALPNAGTR